MLSAGDGAQVPAKRGEQLDFPGGELMFLGKWNPRWARSSQLGLRWWV